MWRVNCLTPHTNKHALIFLLILFQRSLPLSLSLSLSLIHSLTPLSNPLIPCAMLLSTVMYLGSLTQSLTHTQTDPVSLSLFLFPTPSTYLPTFTTANLYVSVLPLFQLYLHNTVVSYHPLHSPPVNHNGTGARRIVWPFGLGSRWRARRGSGRGAAQAHDRRVRIRQFTDSRRDVIYSSCEKKKKKSIKKIVLPTQGGTSKLSSKVTLSIFPLLTCARVCPARLLKVPLYIGTQTRLQWYSSSPTNQTVFL